MMPAERYFFNMVVTLRNARVTWDDIDARLNRNGSCTAYRQLCEKYGLERYDYIPKGYSRKERMKHIVSRCVDKRRQGMTWPEVAEAVGLANANSAKAYFHHCCKILGLDRRALLNGGQNTA